MFLEHYSSRAFRFDGVLAESVEDKGLNQFAVRPVSSWEYVFGFLRGSV